MCNFDALKWTLKVKIKENLGKNHFKDKWKIAH